MADQGTMAGDYPPAVWRLIIERAPRTGAWNMALDEAIMDAVAAGEALPTLRFYAWEPPCLSLGKRQPLDGVDLDALPGRWRRCGAPRNGWICYPAHRRADL